MNILIKIFKRLLNDFVEIPYRTKLLFYILFIKRYKIRALKRKEVIKVAFILTEPGMWKTESLYLEMLKHPRFSPVLVVVPAKQDATSTERMASYIQGKGYAYLQVQGKETIQSVCHPDIIFYQQPWPEFLEKKYAFQNNLSALFCHVNYCFRNTLTPLTMNLHLLNVAWLYFVENEMCREETAQCMTNRGINLVATGIPVMDELSNANVTYPTVWKPQDREKKKIIYAPHHTVLNINDVFEQGTFLKYGEAMQELAGKYKDSIQWAFKPHPFLRGKLDTVWGKERTDAYYDFWAKEDNCQFENGKYDALFRQSDALIHDCGSFMIEYLYTGRPALFLFDKDKPLATDQTRLSLESREQHYSAYDTSDIEKFVQMILKDEDPMAEGRRLFVQKNLTTSPEGSVSHKIITAILDQSTYDKHLSLKSDLRFIVMKLLRI